MTSFFEGFFAKIVPILRQLLVRVYQWLPLAWRKKLENFWQEKFLPRWQDMWQDEKKRLKFLQSTAIIVLLLLFLYFLKNVLSNFAMLSKDFSFDFLFSPANYDINQHMALIPYEPSDTHLRAAMVGVLGTINITLWGSLVAVVWGFLVALARLSPNFLLNRLALVYIETIRNIPLLIQILFWNIFFAITLPTPEHAINFGGNLFLTNDGLYFPKFIFVEGKALLVLSILMLAFGLFFLKRYAYFFRLKSGHELNPIIYYGGMAFLVFLPIMTVLFFVQGQWQFPSFGDFTYEGGSLLSSIFLALLMGLALYASSYVAETVRGAILSISHGQREAGMALGLSRPQINRLILIPQALRMIIPPMSSELIGLLKNSALAIAIGYVDISTTLASSTLNITGREMECMILAIGFYLTLSLIMSGTINWYNKEISKRM